jgi:hypothetical protein
MAEALINSLLSKTATPAAVSAAETDTADKKHIDLIIPTVRAGRAIAENGINREQTNAINLIVDEMNKLPGAVLLKNTQKALAAYKTEHKTIHPESETILKTAEASAKDDKKLPEYQVLLAKKKEISKSKKHISATARVVGAVVAQEVVRQCVEVAMANEPSLKKLTVGSLLDGNALVNKGVYALFRDGKYSNASIEKFKREEKVRMDIERAAIEAASNKNAVHNVNPSVAKTVEPEATTDAVEEVDEDDNLSPKDFVTYTQQICKNVLAEHRAKQILAGVSVPEKSVSVEGELKKLFSEIAFDVLDIIGHGIIASFKYSKHKTLSGDNVEEIISIILGCAKVPESECETIFKRINEVVEQHKDLVKSKKDSAEAKKPDETKQKLLQDKAEKQARQTAVNEIRNKYKDVIKTEIQALIKQS